MNSLTLGCNDDISEPPDEPSDEPREEPPKILYVSASSLNQDPSNALVIRVKLHLGDNPITITAMLDTGASNSFISTALVKEHEGIAARKKKAQRLEVVDGRPVKSGLITHDVTTIASYPDHPNTPPQQITLNVTSLGHYDVILGMDWLLLTKPCIDWESCTISFYPSVATPDAQPAHLDNLEK